MKLVVYTTIFDDFDSLKTPKVINENIFYLCYTDKKLKCYPWKINIVKTEYQDSRRENRKYKILMKNNIFDNFDSSVYVDGNFTITCDLNEYVEDWLGDNDIAVQQHPWRNCLYTEAMENIKLKLDKKRVIKKQIKKYKKEGYPKNNGLTENSILIRRHTNEIKELNRMWWNEVKNNSTRDQISLIYILYKLDVKYSIFPFPNPRNGDKKFFFYRSHKKWENLKKDLT